MNPPSARSASVELACFSRNRPFGVITTSGRAVASSACLRSRWKNCAAVVALATRMFSCAASWRKRSSRALECSGPFPSYPCGRRSVSREVWPHFERPATRNWSTTICAPLTKSPNCASQRTSASGAATAYPYSKPRHAYSESGEL
jgi:hypothetical protein